MTQARHMVPHNFKGTGKGNSVCKEIKRDGTWVNVLKPHIQRTGAFIFLTSQTERWPEARILKE